MIKFHLRQQPEAWHTAQDEDADEHALPPILCPARRQLCVLASPMPLPGYVAGRSLAHCGLQSHRCAADCVASGGGAVRRGAAQCGKLQVYTGDLIWDAPPFTPALIVVATGTSIGHVDHVMLVA